MSRLSLRAFDLDLDLSWPGRYLLVVCGEGQLAVRDVPGDFLARAICPSSSSRESRLSTSRWMVRRIGRAPNSGWYPCSAIQSTAAGVNCIVTCWACSRRRVSSSSSWVICRSSASLQLAEDDDLVDPVQELGPERLAEPPHQLLLQVVLGARSGPRPRSREAERAAAPGDQVRAEVAGHDEDRVPKSTVRPWPSVSRPSSSTWSRMLNTCGWAFSISSSRIRSRAAAGPPR